MQTTYSLQHVPADTILSIVRADLVDRKTRRAKAALREWLITHNTVSLFDLNRIGGTLLDIPQPDLCTTGVFIQRWETADICGQDEELAQRVADICQELTSRIHI